MLIVHELLELPLFQNFRLVAGEKGLGRPILNTTILEYETYINGFQVFHPGDFILTSLFFAKDDPSLIKQSLSELLAREIAAVAVKTTFYSELPADVIAYADEKKLPIFLFDEIYMEDIIVGINEVIKKKEAYHTDERIMQKFINPRSLHDVVTFAGQFCHFAYGRYFIACLSPISSSISIENIFNYLSYQYKSLKQNPEVGFVKYQNKMFLIYNFPADVCPDIRQIITTQLQTVSANLSDFYCGVGDIQTELINFDTALEQAMTANYIAVFKQQPFLHYSETGIYQYIYPLLHNRPFMKEYENTIHILTEYDTKYHSELFETLQVYVKYNGKISATAKEFFQHPNTIRYRLQKAEELLNTENFYEYIFLVIHIYELMQANNCRKI
ncbi:MAG: PucR family transcriptional regulator ligand-binding domain-containing protein [Eubacteriales bacterium]|nr:PucR family transcriptional regulator ligand-binding domain-containing protein [Eubacteriales bacterium]